jgi:hypothetical protein
MFSAMLPLALLVLGLDVRPEHQRPDPFGGVVDADRDTAATKLDAISTARGAYASFHLVVKLDAPGEYELGIDSRLPADVFREWFHLTAADRKYFPDALVPVKLPYRSAMPDPENRIPNQTAQAFWIDVWVPADTAPGNYRVTATLRSGGETTAKSVDLQVLRATVPPDDVVTMDHNSYGSSFLADQYPKLAAQSGDGFVTSDAFFGLIHAYHRIFYEHRGTLHQLGYGHGGKVAPEFAPELAGSGRGKRIANWDLYDRHYGPLLDGSAFRNTRRGARPIPFVYLPINPEWPASFLWWDEPGYETEFVNVVSEMERHFREKGWVNTRFELFFNHKKRYKAFPWDGDEVRFARDNAYFKKYGELFRKAVPASTPVKFVFRNDASWTMERQFTELAGVVNMWICSGGILSWNRDAVRPVRERGDIIWYYGAPPEVTRPSATITELVLRAWLWDIHGFVHWLTVSAGPDPWFRFDGGGTALVYPGERFGIEGPLASIRLKIQRNALQDLALAQSLAKGTARERLQTEVAKRFSGSSPADWWIARPALADRPPDDWTNSDIDDALGPSQARRRKVDAAAWQRTRDLILQRVREGQ